MEKSGPEQEFPEQEFIVQPAARLTVIVLLAVVLLLGAELAWFVELRRNFSVSRELLENFWRISVVLGGALVLFVFFYRRVTTIRLTRTNLTKSSGLLVRRYSRVELSKVTNSSAKRTLLALLFGLVDISIDTPGGFDSSEISMRFVAFSKARELLERIAEFRAITAESGIEPQSAAVA